MYKAGLYKDPVNGEESSHVLKGLSRLRWTHKESLEPVEQEQAAAPGPVGIRSHRRVASRDPDGYRDPAWLDNRLGLRALCASKSRPEGPRPRTLRQGLKYLLAPAVPPECRRMGPEPGHHNYLNSVRFP